MFIEHPTGLWNVDRITIKGGNNSYLLLGSVTTAQRDTLPTVNGTLVYNSTTGAINSYESDAWGAIGSGDVVGPATSTNNAIARFDLATGKLLQNSGIIINDTDDISGVHGLTSTAHIDLGSSWDFRAHNLTADALTAARVVFTGADGLLSVDAAFVWDNTNKRVGIGIAAPEYPLHIVGEKDDTNNFQGFQINFTANSTANGSYRNRGFQVDAIADIDSGITNNKYMYGGHILARAQGLGTISEVTGLVVYSEITAGETTTVGNLRGLYIDIDHLDGTISGDVVSLYIAAPTTGATVTGDEYSIYSANIAASYFAGDVGIGTATPDANAILDVTSTTKAFLPPRMTTIQKSAVASPLNGMVLYDTDLAKLCVYTTSWETITSA